jgi:hypothetical protein
MMPYYWLKGPFTMEGFIHFNSATRPDPANIPDPIALLPNHDNLHWQWVGHNSYNNLVELAQSQGLPSNEIPQLLPAYSNWNHMLKSGYSVDPDFVNKIRNPTNGYTKVHGILYYTFNDQVRICVPNTHECNTIIKNTLLDKIHTSLGHAGFTKTLHGLMNNFYWPKMTRDTREYCQTCSVCQQAKNSTQKPYGLLHPLPIPSKPFTHLTMDFLALPAVIDHASKVRYSHVWTIVCRLTKYTLVLPLPDGYTAESLVNLFMFLVYPHFGYPLDIVTDNDTLFHSQVWAGFCKLNSINQSFSTPYHPESDGQSEIANKAILAILRAKQLEHGGSWLPAIPLVQEAINNSVDATRGCTPHSLVFRFSPTYQDTPVGTDIPTIRPDGLTQAMWAAVQEKMNTSRVDMTRQANKKRRRSPEYKIGDLAKIHHSGISRISQYSKLEPIFLGPYPISAVYPDTDNYTLECPLVPSGHIKVHTSLLAPWHKNDDTKFPSRSLPEPGPLEFDTKGDRYAFERIVKHEKDKRTGAVRYWVKWEGYGDDQNTLEPEDSMPASALKAYWKQHAWVSKPQKKRRTRRNR